MEIFLKIDAFYRSVLTLQATYRLPRFLPMRAIFFNDKFFIVLNAIMPRYSFMLHLISGFEDKALAGLTTYAWRATIADQRR